MELGKTEPPWTEQFPIFTSHDYDFLMPHMPWAIGIKSTFPEELVKRIVAAALSMQLGYRGVDRAYKMYLEDHSYEMNDGNRLDTRVAKIISAQSAAFSNLIYQVTALGDKKHGGIIAEWTFLRIPRSIEMLVTVRAPWRVVRKRRNITHCFGAGGVGLTCKRHGRSEGD
jgi:hypothetical protein